MTEEQTKMLLSYSQNDELYSFFEQAVTWAIKDIIFAPQIKDTKEFMSDFFKAFSGGEIRKMIKFCDSKINKIIFWHEYLLYVQDFDIFDLFRKIEDQRSISGLERFSKNEKKDIITTARLFQHDFSPGSRLKKAELLEQAMKIIPMTYIDDWSERKRREAIDWIFDDIDNDEDPVNPLYDKHKMLELLCQRVHNKFYALHKISTMNENESRPYWRLGNCQAERCRQFSEVVKLSTDSFWEKNSPPHPNLDCVCRLVSEKAESWKAETFSSSVKSSSTGNDTRF